MEELNSKGPLGENRWISNMVIMENILHTGNYKKEKSSVIMLAGDIIIYIWMCIQSFFYVYTQEKNYVYIIYKCI